MIRLSSSRRRIVIRTDANPTISAGHVMRCLSVADALRGMGAEVLFAVSDDIPCETISARGYSACVLASDWHDLMGGSKLVAKLCSENDAVTLIDTYSITREFVDFLSETAPVCYLGSKGGDLGQLSLIANYSTDIDVDSYERTYGSRGTRLLLGPKYAPLRPGFAEVFRSRDKVERVLVTTGNTDRAGFAAEFLRCATSSDQAGSLTFDVIIGGLFSTDEAHEIERMGRMYPKIRIHRSVSDMAGLMAACDIAVTANGTTVYELAAAGVPAVTFALVEEQVQSAESLARLGATCYVGSLTECGANLVANRAVAALEGLIAGDGEASALATKAHNLIDGHGAVRIAEELMYI